MAKISVYDMTGAVVSDLELNDNIFGIEPNTVVMHAAVVNYLANQRQGTQSTLTRTEVSGGGKKPWLSLIHIGRCRRLERCRARWWPYH